MKQEDWHRSGGFLESAERVVTANVLGPIRLIAASIEHLLTRPAAAIVTVSSGLAFVPMIGTPSYNASKAAIHMLSETLRLQLDDFADEAISLWDSDPTVHEVLVDRVKFLRNAEAEGRYDATVTALNATVTDG